MSSSMFARALPTSNHVSVDSTLGAILIGLMITAILFGVTISQCFMYYNRYYRDGKVLKWLVGLVLFLDTLHTAIVGHILYHYLVTNYTNVHSLDIIVWSLALEVGLTTFATAAVQGFFIWRIWMLSSGNMILCGVIFVLSFTAFVSGWGCMIETFLLRVIANIPKIEWVVGVKHGSIAAADIMIVIGQCWYLHHSRTGFKSTDTLINTLMVYTVNRGVLNSMAALADLICFLLMPYNFVWLAFNFIMSKLYTNSLLATLNARDALRGKGTDTEMESVTTLAFQTGGKKNVPRTRAGARTRGRTMEPRATAVSFQVDPSSVTESSEGHFGAGEKDQSMTITKDAASESV